MDLNRQKCSIERAGKPRERKFSVGGRNPTAVFAQHPSTRHALHGDRPHHSRGIWIEPALHLNHFMRSAANYSVKARLDNCRTKRSSVFPVTEKACPIPRKLVVPERNSMLNPSASKIAKESRVDIVTQDSTGIVGIARPRHISRHDWVSAPCGRAFAGKCDLRSTSQTRREFRAIHAHRSPKRADIS